MMNRKIINRVYVDTSVVGGMFDREFEQRIKPFWSAVAGGKIRIIVSDILEEELENSPVPVREFFHRLPQAQMERVSATEDSDALAEQYVIAGVVGKTSIDDCRHIALATIVCADVLVSLNFKHIVNVKRIYGYNGVNMVLGYPAIEIRTPDEVIHDESDLEY
ncbi:MAG: hypothetical protein FWD31_04885 [Planctomycetaceae bacterium]|nr:hypothetical protein [Planctomycetaceae bacterium]